MSAGQRSGLIAAIICIAVGYLLFANSSSMYDECQSGFGMFVRSLDPNTVNQCNQYSLEHFGSIAIMGLGGIFLLIALLVPRRPA